MRGLRDLDHYHVVETHAVVLSPANEDCPLIQETKPGNRLAGLQNRGGEPFHLCHLSSGANVQGG